VILPHKIKRISFHQDLPAERSFWKTDSTSSRISLGSWRSCSSSSWLIVIPFREALYCLIREVTRQYSNGSMSDGETSSFSKPKYFTFRSLGSHCRIPWNHGCLSTGQIWRHRAAY
jgi:hypothetical protein